MSKYFDGELLSGYKNVPTTIFGERNFIDMGIQKKICDLKSKLSLTEKALELACKKLEFCPHLDESVCKCIGKLCKDCILEYFKTKAKEIMKSE